MDIKMEAPECDKMIAIQDKSMILSNFVDWLGSSGYAICTFEETPGYPKEQWISIRKSYEKLFAEYFGIDLKKVEQEKRAVLESLRNQNDK